MKIFKNKKKLLKEIIGLKNIAFIPTMGSLHKGHISLIKKAKKETENILVSIYVNPKQFNSNLDYQKYPRNINKDIALLKKIKIKYLYLPTYKDIFSFKTKKTVYLDKFSKQLCGKSRPGHFEGVLDIVNRFIEIIKPHSIFLGIKDFQQLALIQIHVNKNKISTNVIACPTIRDINGIALSSRNSRLNKKQIESAGKIYQYLKINKKRIVFSLLRKHHLKIINKIILFGAKKIDYLECVNLKKINVSKKIKNKYKLFISYNIGGVRLIDNL